MGLSLKDVVPSRWGLQAESQGAGTPNSMGLSGFVPLWVGTQSLVYLDSLTNVDLPDIGNTSSLTHTPVVGSTVATSTRLGYRWLNGDRSWAFGVMGGYDTRPLATGQPDAAISISNTQTLFFQQLAAGLEAYGATWDLKAYALLPIGNTTGAINNAYDAGALTTYGLDVGYAITSNLHSSLGYYYQDSDLQGTNGSGVLLNVDYDIGDSLTIGVTLSYDDIFETRLSANVKYRLGSWGTSKKKNLTTRPLEALAKSPEHRLIRVHDHCALSWCSKEKDNSKEKAKDMPESSEETKSQSSAEAVESTAEDASKPSESSSEAGAAVATSSTKVTPKAGGAAESVDKTVGPDPSPEPIGSPVHNRLKMATSAGRANLPSSPTADLKPSSAPSASTIPNEPEGSTRLSETRQFLCTRDAEAFNSPNEDSGMRSLGAADTVNSPADERVPTRSNEPQGSPQIADDRSASPSSTSTPSSDSSDSRRPSSDSGGSRRSR